MRVVLLVLFAGCATQSAADVEGACTMLEGRTFASVGEGECGLGPSGPVPCTWHLQFSSDTSAQSAFMWQHSDYGVAGSVVCQGMIVTGMDFNATYAGYFDDATGTLRWEGVDYVVLTR